MLRANLVNQVHAMKIWNKDFMTDDGRLHFSIILLKRRSTVAMREQLMTGGANIFPQIGFIF